MGRISNLNERALIALVHDGRWQIDADGRVWITKSRRRAEHRTRDLLLPKQAFLPCARCGESLLDHGFGAECRLYVAAKLPSTSTQDSPQNTQGETNV